MGIKGPEKIKQKLTSCLDPVLLVDLSADLLFARGFKDIRKTDGPGDGGRDLYALGVDGEKILVQCKFHSDCEKTSSSKELSELPMALVKLNYSKGIFITNGKISPQSKREYLDNYKNLKLIFIDGNDLALEVIENPLLKAVWFDGHDFYKVSNSISFPLLIREHVSDLPFIITKHLSVSEIEKLTKNTNDRFDKLIITFNDSRIESDCFEPYKAPEPLSVEEGGSPIFSSVEIMVEGLNILADVFEIRKNISEEIIVFLADKMDEFTLRFGKPSVSTRVNSQKNKIILDVKPKSYIKTALYKGDELTFINAKNSVNWSSVNDARVTEAGSIRLYCHELDVCLDYSIESRIAWKVQLSEIAKLEDRKIGWDKSLFCLIENHEKWPYQDIPEPDESSIWIDERYKLCAWFHFSLLGWPSEVRSRSNDGIGTIFKLPDEDDWNLKLCRIKESLSGLEKIQFIDTDKARHMVAIIGVDPLGLEKNVKYITGEVLEYPDIIPSPILPASRIFSLEIVWKLPSDCPVLEHDLRAELDLSEFVSGFEIYLQENYCHIRIDVDITKFVSNTSNKILGELYDLAKILISKLESIFPENSFIVTKEYWKSIFNVSLGVEWNKSGKSYGFIDENSDGEPADFHDVMSKLTS